ncbi:MAG TPA: glycosyltransferase family 9 protein [bacterium]
MSAPVDVLVLGPSNIGDGILVSPVIQRLHARVPSARLTLCVGERAIALFEDDPRIGTLVCLDDFPGVWGRLRLLGLLWRLRPAWLVDLRRTALPVFWRPWRIMAYIRPAPRALIHMRDRHLWRLGRQVPAARGAADRTDAASLWLSEQDRRHAESLLSRFGVPAGARIALLCPGARSHIKRWTAAGFAEVADRLAGERGLEIVFSGEPEEREVVAEVLGLMRARAHNAVGLTTIRQAGALMRRAAVVITNDSASLHLASACNVPTVAMFGPTDARKYGPRAAHRRVLRRQLFCSPCERALCRFNLECMRFISPEEVYHAACELLGEA